MPRIALNIGGLTPRVSCCPLRLRLPVDFARKDAAHMDRDRIVSTAGLLFEFYEKETILCPATACHARPLPFPAYSSRKGETGTGVLYQRRLNSSGLMRRNQQFQELAAISLEVIKRRWYEESAWVAMVRVLLYPLLILIPMINIVANPKHQTRRGRVRFFLRKSRIVPVSIEI